MQVVDLDQVPFARVSRRSGSFLLPGAEAEEYDHINRIRVFEESDHINELRLPIDTGDIFAFFDASKSWETQPPNRDFWIIVLQRCDLAIRQNGKRSYAPTLMPLVRVASPSQGDESSAGAAKRIQLFSAPVRSHPASEIRLAERRFAPSLALDACALNYDGISRINIQNPPSVEGLVPSWVELMKLSQQWARKKITRYKELHARLPGQVHPDLNTALFSSVTGAVKEVGGFNSVIEPEQGRILFGVRRVARLREPYIQDVLDRLSSLSSRIPLDALLDPDR